MPIAGRSSYARAHTIGHFDVGPELVPPGRVMIPYRAVAQALGALVFWNDADESVTVETWRSIPAPTQQTVKKVTVYRGQNYADVMDRAGNQSRIETSRPAMDADPRDGGYTLDVIEWFKLWGVSEDNILYDAARGGIAVRGASGMYPEKASGYLYFYVGEKFGWNNFFEKTKHNLDVSGENFIQNDRLYSGNGALNGVQYLYGKIGSGPMSVDSISFELKD